MVAMCRTPILPRGFQLTSQRLGIPISTLHFRKLIVVAHRQFLSPASAAITRNCDR
jgi:hypothetical protein